MTENGLSVISQLIASIIYLIMLPFGDFFGRHLSLYNAFTFDDESSFRYFFFGETIVILFGLIISIGFIHGGSSGTLGAILYFRIKLYVLGVLISIFLFLVLMLTIFHIILTIQVYRLFRSKNYTICPRPNPGPTVVPVIRRI
ncbi:10774_t:CDS:2 [Funneliformis geosporum]|nr:10774_t:CDS:2 [Funneliformis geosporum]